MFKSMAVRGLLVAAAAAAAVIAMSGAGTNRTAPEPAKRTYVLGVIAKSQSNPVFIAARTGAEDAAKELGQKLGVEIKIDWRTPVSEDGQKQAEFLEQLVAAGADGIAISCSDANVATLAINSAVDKGVPVVTFDSDAPRSKRLAYYGTDDFACGQQVAAELGKAMGGKGVVAILAGNQNAPNLQARVKGVKEGVKQFSEITVLDTYYHAETAQDAVARLEQVQAANPQITGWAFIGGWPLYTENALANIAGKAKVVSVDALPQCLVYVKKGDVEVLLGQKVYEWGYESVRLLMDNLVDGKKPADPIVKAELVPVTAANADEYGKNWDKWLGQTKGRK